MNVTVFVTVTVKSKTVEPEQDFVTDATHGRAGTVTTFPLEAMVVDGAGCAKVKV